MELLSLSEKRLGLRVLNHDTGFWILGQRWQLSMSLLGRLRQEDRLSLVHGQPRQHKETLSSIKVRDGGLKRG